MTTIEVKVPNIGDFTGVPVIEVMVAADDVVSTDDPLIMLESDKAAMEVPSPYAGRVRDVKVAVGDTVEEGSLILLLETQADADAKANAQAHTGNGAALDQAPNENADPSPEADQATPASPIASPIASPSASPSPGTSSSPSTRLPTGSATPAPVLADFSNVHASPAVRRLARELDIDLTQVSASGAKGRITKDDVKAHMAGAGTPSGGGLPPLPAVDFAQFGEIEVVPMSRIQKISGPHLHRSWLNIPHVTHNEEADITALDRFRKELDTAAKAEGYRVTLLSFLMKACASALDTHWQVNASLTPEGTALVRKHYTHIGIAVDTPGGLVVPVVRDCDKKGIVALSKELGALSEKAREGKLSPAEMSGGSFTISSLGGIGGTGFTPIVNAPQVAILGVTRSRMTAVWDPDGKTFAPRNMLPLSLSYDHRAIDGALAARFCATLKHILADVRRLLL